MTKFVYGTGAWKLMIQGQLWNISIWINVNQDRWSQYTSLSNMQLPEDCSVWIVALVIFKAQPTIVLFEYHIKSSKPCILGFLASETIASEFHCPHMRMVHSSLFITLSNIACIIAVTLREAISLKINSQNTTYVLFVRYLSQLFIYCRQNMLATTSIRAVHVTCWIWP